MVNNNDTSSDLVSMNNAEIGCQEACLKMVSCNVFKADAMTHILIGYYEVFFVNFHTACSVIVS